MTRPGPIASVLAAATVAAALTPAARAAESPPAVAPSRPPPFDEALAAARKAGKPLVIDFGAEWCEPCKMLEADLKKPAGQAALQLVYFVRYDVDEPPGTAVKDKFRINSYPTLMAIDGEGKEADRQVGYGELDGIRAWLARVPSLTVSLRESLAYADGHRTDPALQLVAGKRLLAVNRPADARRYLSRATSAGEATAAASAIWTLADAEVAAQALPIRRRHAERLAARYPTSPEGLRALRFLATLPEPPRALVAQVIDKRLAAAAQPEALEELVLYGLRGGAVEAAEKAALRLEPMAAKDSQRLLVVAEAFHMKGDQDRAVALGEKALAASSGPARAAVEKDLARFRGGDRLPGSALAALTAEGDDGRRSSDAYRGMPAWVTLVPKIARKIADECAPIDEPLGELPVYVMSGARPEELKVVPDRPLPAATVRCMEKAARTVEVPPGQSFSVTVTLDPPWLAAGLAIARKTAADCLTPPAPGEHVESLRVVLTSAGEHPALIAPPGAPAPCLERAFWFVRLPPGMVRSLLLAPPRRPPPPKPLTAANNGARP
jgi:thioredoxin-like negative regulator of GroEL